MRKTTNTSKISASGVSLPVSRMSMTSYPMGSDYGSAYSRHSRMSYSQFSQSRSISPANLNSRSIRNYNTFHNYRNKHAANANKRVHPNHNFYSTSGSNMNPNTNNKYRFIANENLDSSKQGKSQSNMNNTNLINKEIIKNEY